MRQVALQHSAELRGQSMTKLCCKVSCVWIDESGCDNRSYMRKYDYSIKGEVPVCR